MEVKVLQDILGANEAIARRSRELLDRHGTLTVNIMSSPGAGKTSLILQTIGGLKSKARLAVIEGDTNLVDGWFAHRSVSLKSSEPFGRGVVKCNALLFRWLRFMVAFALSLFYATLT